MNDVAASAFISPHADIETSSRGTIVSIGDNCYIDSFVKIKTVGGLGNVIIHHDCHINSGTVIYSGNGVEIGPHTLIAANCTLAPVNHCYDKKSLFISQQGFKESRGGILIGKDVWIGAGCCILDGARIPDGVVIGALSLVRGELESYGIYAGNPLQLMRFRK